MSTQQQLQQQKDIRLESAPLETEEQRGAGNRSRLYLLLCSSFAYPDASFCESLAGGELAAAARELMRSLPYTVPEAGRELAGLEEAAGQARAEDVQIEFVRLFEAGIGGPPCALVEGMYDRDRKEVMKELILFYNHFGLSYAEGDQAERPDHICLETEFLHYLTFKEVHALQCGKDPAAYRRAQRDFLARHPLSWIGKASDKLGRISENVPENAARAAILFFNHLLRLSHRFLEADHRYLQARLEH
ncbi:MAG: molecular chaperone TorD family protein [bacterium]